MSNPNPHHNPIRWRIFNVCCRTIFLSVCLPWRRRGHNNSKIGVSDLPICVHSSHCEWNQISISHRRMSLTISHSVQESKPKAREKSNIEETISRTMQECWDLGFRRATENIWELNCGKTCQISLLSAPRLTNHLMYLKDRFESLVFSVSKKKNVIKQQIFPTVDNAFELDSQNG